MERPIAVTRIIYEKAVDFERESVYIKKLRHSALFGGLVLTGKAAVLKTAGLCGPWGFESLVLRFLERWPSG